MCEKTNTRIAFLVLSCDKYSDLWDPYYKLFNQFWGDCPFDKYFASNNLPFLYGGFESILIGNDQTWSKGLYDSVSFLEDKYDYVLITLEDLFLIDKVDTLNLLETIYSFMENKGNYLRLSVKRNPHTPFNKYFGVLRKHTLYRQNCVYSLWNIKTLKEIIDINENAWEFEKKGVARSYIYDGFYSSYINYFIISNSVVKGKWVRPELNKVKLLLPDIIISRKIFSWRENIIMQIYEYVFSVFFRFVSWRMQSIYLSFLRKNS
jgi:hypothetical protein